MNNAFTNLFFRLPIGMRLFLLLYAVSYPVLLVEHVYFKSAVIESWLALSPALVWKGQLWRVVTYAMLGGGILEWAVNLFWLVTLGSILARDWSSLSFWMFCSFTAFSGALPLVLLTPGGDMPVLSAGAVVFGLLAAWARLYGRERIIMLGIGEMSVRQAAMFVAAINAVIVFFACGGLLLTLSMMCGGVAGWIYLVIGSHRVMRRRSQPVASERMARLEL